jgi:PAS domain S-box-containing protein
MKEPEKTLEVLSPQAARPGDQQMELLHRAGRALTSVLDLDQVLDTLLSEMRTLLGAVASSVWLTEVETGRLVCRQSSGPRSEQVEGWVLEPGEGIAGWVVQQGESLNVADVTTDPRYYTEVGQAANLEIRTLLTVPLQLRGQTIGALQLIDEQPGRFSKADLSLLESLAAFAAIGIENARLYERSQREIEKRRKMEAALQESERRYRALIENVHDVLYDVNAEGLITYISAQAEQYGIEPEALVGTSMDEAFRYYVHPEDRGKMEQAFAERAEKGQTTYQFRIHLRGSEKALWFEDTGRVYKDAAGRPAGVIGMLRDVSERKEAEEALRRSEERLRRLVESAEDIICVHDAEGRYLYYSGPSRYGVTGKTLVGKSPYDLFAMEKAQPIVEQIQTVFASGESLVSENQVEWQGESLWFLDQLYPIEDERGRVVAVGKIARNITARKRMEATVRESELKYRTLVESALYGIVIFQDGRIVYANETAAEQTGYPNRKLLALSPDEIARLFPPDERQRNMEILHRRLVGEDLIPYREYRVQQLDGSIRWMEGAVGRIEYRGRPALQIISSDVTERRAMEEALRRSEEQFRSIVEGSYDGIVLTDGEGQIVTWNRGAERITGIRRAEALEQPIWEIQFRLGNETERRRPGIREQLRTMIQQALQEGHAPWLERITEREIERPDGSSRIIQTLAFLIVTEGQFRFGSVIRDMTAQKEAEAALRETKEALEQLIHASPAAIITVDGEGRVLRWNPAAERIFGWQAEEVLGRPNPIVPPESREFFLQNLEDSLRGKRLIDADLRRRRKDGTFVDVSISNAPLYDEEGEVVEVLGVFLDISERKEAEQALRESEDRFRTMANSAPVMIWMADVTGACTYFNQRWLDFRGRTLEEELGDGWAEGVHPEDLDYVLETYRAAVEAQRSYTIEYRVRRADGEYRWLLDVGTPRHSPNGTLLGFIGSCTDITEQKGAEQAERRQTEQLRALATRLTQVEEAEHQRLARELHDRVGQNLTAIGINLNIIGSLLPEESPLSVRERLDDSRTLVEEVTESTRAMMSDLRPPVLDDYGLPATLHWYAEHFAARTGIAVEIKVEEIEPRLPLQREVALFRVAQEALTNVAKHAQATQVRITLQVQEEKIRLVVEDDGTGFAGAVPGEPQESEGWGLLTMKERAVALGGELRIESEPGEGTRVCVKAPR